MYIHIFFFVGWISYRLLHVCACCFLGITLADLPSTLCEFLNSKLKPSGQVCSLEHPLLVFRIHNPKQVLDACLQIQYANVDVNAAFTHPSVITFQIKLVFLIHTFGLIA